VPKHSGGLELTWTDKDKTLLSVGDGQYDYTFVNSFDYRVSEIRLLHEVEHISAQDGRPEDSELPEPTTDNVLITGDSMHVLDALAKIPEYSTQYLGKVKLVYIDPPFNTGLTFEHYEDNIEHSIWLTMLRDRLRQIRPLLASSGSVWVHLDDVEVHRCRVVLDEEFGPENFVAEVAWRKRTSVANDSATFTSQHDIILVYGKSQAVKINRLPRALTKDDLRYRSVDGDPRPWGSFGNTSASENLSGRRQRPSVYAIQHPLTGKMIYPPRGGHWRDTERLRAALNEYADWLEVPPNVATRCAETGLTPEQVRDDVPDLVLADPVAARESAQKRIDAGCWPEFFVQATTFGRKTYQSEDRTSPPSTWWSDTETGHNRESRSEIKALFPGINPFSTPKPERLLERIIRIATDPGDIVLDCYVGSGTTAAVAHKMGRRWVASELSASTIETYAKPRLAKVVRGEDPGGITALTERVPADDVELPDGVPPQDAVQFQRILGKVLGDEEPALTVDLAAELARITRTAAKAGDGPLEAAEVKYLLTLLKKIGADPRSRMDVTSTVKSQLNRLTKTRDRRFTIWHGGGGFKHLQVGRSMFEDIDGIIVLADWATQGELAKAMCAQLAVRYEPNGIFSAVKGNVRYVVIDGLVGEGTIASILDQAPTSEIVQVWATQVDESAADKLRQERPGSRLETIPDSVLDSYRRKAAKGSPFTRRSSKQSAESTEEGEVA
jgi:adenine-specific DNA-methyltransferase